jgi:D-amino-acid dehydrogenase
MPNAGQGASRANGAQLSYSYVEPLATPATLRALPGWLLSADSPCTGGRGPSGLTCAGSLLHAGMPLVAGSQHDEGAAGTVVPEPRHLHAWLEEQPGMGAATLHDQPGKLVIYRDPAARSGVQRQLAWQAAMGCEQQMVEADECRLLEPALAATGGGTIAFGVWTPSEESSTRQRLRRSWHGPAEQRSCSAARSAAFEMRAMPSRAARLGRGEGSIAADHFVLATGPSAASLLSPLGLALPLEPIKGYSVTLPIVDAAAAPRASVTDSARKLVHARLGDHLRVAGFAELCGHDRVVQARRIAALCAAVRETLPRSVRLRRQHGLGRSAPRHPERPAARRTNALEQPVGQRRPRRAGPDARTRQCRGAGQFPWASDHARSTPIPFAWKHWPFALDRSHATATGHVPQGDEPTMALKHSIRSAAGRAERTPCGSSACTLTGTSGSRVRTCRLSLVLAAAVNESMMAGPKPCSASTMAM